MGTFTHSITLISDSGRTETVEALVDTGATFTAVPAAVLEQLGVVPDYTVSLRLANGQIDRVSIGEVRAELDGVRHTIGVPATNEVLQWLGTKPREILLSPADVFFKCCCHGE